MSDAIPTGYKGKIPEDIAMFNVPDFKREELINAFVQLVKVSEQRPKSIVVELNTYRKYVPFILKAYCMVSDLNKKATMEAHRCVDIEYDRGNKRWSSEEDETLINLVCSEEYNIHKISTVLGRSPNAIQTRISFLVGRSRLTQEVAGRFIGTINGISANAEIKGTVFKEGGTR